MVKKLDALHYILILLFIGSLIFYNLPEEQSINANVPEDNYEYLMAKFKADSLFLSNEYDEAIKEYQRVDSLYPFRVNLPAMQLLVEERKNGMLAYNQDSPPLNTENSNSTPSSNPTKENVHTSRSIHSNRIIENNPSADSSNTEDLHQVGEIVKGVLHLINYDGAKIDYIGEVKNGKANGYGFAVFEHKGFYEGEWADNMRNGKGIYSWQNGDVYDGQYVNGKRTGYGIYTFASGEVYKGSWKDNFRHGEGILYNKKGKIVSNGPWIQDEPVLQKRVKKKKK